MDPFVHMKGRNNNIFSNIDTDPRDTIQLAEIQSKLWYKAHKSLQQVTQTREMESSTLPQNPGRWCCTDRSLKAQDNFSGQGWYNTI